MFLRRVGLSNRDLTKMLLTSMLVVSLGGLASSASASTLCVNQEGKKGCSATIGAAVASAAPGDVISVWPGVYREQVTITQSLSLISVLPLGAVIDATNLPNGIWVNGMSAAPNPGVANVVISGFKVRGADFEGFQVQIVGQNHTLLAGQSGGRVRGKR